MAGAVVEEVAEYNGGGGYGGGVRGGGDGGVGDRVAVGFYGAAAGRCRFGGAGAAGYDGFLRCCS